MMSRLHRHQVVCGLDERRSCSMTAHIRSSSPGGVSIYERQDPNVRREMQQERLRSEQFAHQLQQEAATQWQKAITGLLALPTATALSVGASEPGGPEQHAPRSS